MSLRVTLNYHADEVRLSLVSRLAIANSYPSLGSFTALNGTSAAAFNSGGREAIELLSSWSGLETECLQPYDITSAGRGATWRLGTALMGKDMRTGRNHRYCPKCVINDLETGKGRVETRPYIRASWMTRAVQHCVEHRCEIVETPFDQLNPGDFNFFVRKNLKTIRAEATETMPQSSIRADEYVTARIQGRSTNEFLDEFEAYVAVDLCRYIGAFEKRHLSKEQMPARSKELSDIERGFTIASAGSKAIEAVISSAVERKQPMAMERGVFFGKLRSWLLRNLTKPEFETVVELFQSIVERCIPIGEDEVFILPGRKRYLHSVRSASIEYHMMEDRVYQLIVDAGLSKPSKLSSGRIYFDAEAGHKVLKAALDTMTSREVASALGIHIDRVRPILDANQLARVEVSEGSRVYSRIRRADFDEFAKKLAAEIATDHERSQLVRVNQVGQIVFCTMPQVVDLIVSKELKTLRRVDDTGLISGLAVDPEELKRFVVQARRQTAKASIPIFDNSEQDPNLLNFAQARQMLGTASGTIRELLNLGYLDTITALNPIVRRTHNYICARSLVAFKEKHISLVHLAERNKMFAITVREKLSGRGIRSAFEPSGRNSRFYLRCDVDHLDLST